MEEETTEIARRIERTLSIHLNREDSERIAAVAESISRRLAPVASDSLVDAEPADLERALEELALREDGP